MKNYNEGRNGLWDNYVSFKGLGKESYMFNTDKYIVSKKYEEDRKKNKGLENPQLVCSIGNKKVTKPL